MRMSSRLALAVLCSMVVAGPLLVAQRQGPPGPGPRTGGNQGPPGPGRNGPGPGGPPLGPPPPTLSAPLPGLNTVQRFRFDDGRREFLAVEQVADGLGPVFNDRSCIGCHFAGGPGGGSNRTVTRFATAVNGVFDPMVDRGGPVIQARGIGEITTAFGTHTFVGERVPPEANLRARRRTPPLFGLGLVDAVPDAVYVALATSQAGDPDGTAGRPNMVTDLATGRVVVGKFGWKSQMPTLRQFGAGAYLGELGITNPTFPDESCPNGDCSLLDFNPVPGLDDDGSGVDAFTDFMTLLAPPARGPIGADERDGEQLLREIGCTSCHVPTLQTGPNAIDALNRVTFHPYSDFLLHDMGSLGDGMVDQQAGGRDMRTAPLWGLRAIRGFLHDGRATTLDEAIRQHDGQGARARDRYATLSPDDQRRLIAFLRSL